jgi:hypothetical protein
VPPVLSRNKGRGEPRTRGEGVLRIIWGQNHGRAEKGFYVSYGAKHGRPDGDYDGPLLTASQALRLQAEDKARTLAELDRFLTDEVTFDGPTTVQDGFSLLMGCPTRRPPRVSWTRTQRLGRHLTWGFAWNLPADMSRCRMRASRHAPEPFCLGRMSIWPWPWRHRRLYMGWNVVVE